ncbi:glycosyltransferase family 2 protein [Planococcus beigongshangi]|uniref:glycosyltransferase family 2 protein n=1 Tax=Planococcus beigongshangi TaxID=2782536 RepID=UPI00193BF6B6|nr:glycosyltransferase family 2 protein [Planococcus beigongshangi]
MESMVSVIIPTCKGSDNLPRALNSILEQTYKSLEVIVVDHNEPRSPARQRTEEAMREYLHLNHVKYIRSAKTQDRSAARNIGITESIGSYLCFLNDDDFYLKERIEKSVELLEENPGYEGIICGVLITDEKRVKYLLIPENPIKQRTLLINESILCMGSNLFLSRHAVEVAGGFNELFNHHDINEFMLRVLEDFEILHLEDILIVKSDAGNSDQPNYRYLRKLKELYMLRFEEVIERLDPIERTRFYITQYEELFYAALYSGKKEYIEQSLRELKLFRGITLKDRFNILFNEKHLSRKKIFRTRGPLYDRSKKRVISKQLKNHMDPMVKEDILNII